MGLKYCNKSPKGGRGGPVKRDLPLESWSKEKLTAPLHKLHTPSNSTTGRESPVLNTLEAIDFQSKFISSIASDSGLTGKGLQRGCSWSCAFCIWLLLVLLGVVESSMAEERHLLFLMDGWQVGMRTMLALFPFHAHDCPMTSKLMRTGSKGRSFIFLEELKNWRFELRFSAVTCHTLVLLRIWLPYEMDWMYCVNVHAPVT
jgi:hypothetical protein